jgi:hypothetical protein
MALDPSTLGTISIAIRGDYGELETALQEARSAAERAGQAIAAALSGPGGLQGAADGTSAFSAQLAGLSEALGNAGQAVQAVEAPVASLSEAIASSAAKVGEAQSQMSLFAEDLRGVGDVVTTSGEQLGLLDQQLAELGAEEQKAAAESEELRRALTETAQQSGAAATEVGSLADRLVALGKAFAVAEGLKIFAEEALHAYSAQQQLAVSFELMSGSARTAEVSLQAVQDLALSIPVPIEQVEHSARRLAAAFGTGEGLTDVLKGAANAAAATGRDFEGVLGALERIQLTGHVSARQLVALGLSWQDLAKSMGTSIAEAQEKLKAGGQSAAKDVEVVLAAIQARFGDAAKRQGETFQGQLTAIKNQVEETFEDVGKALAPTVTELLKIVNTDILPFVRKLAEGFAELPEPIRHTVVAVGALTVAIAGLKTAAEALGVLSALRGILAGIGAAAGGTAVAGSAAAGLAATTTATTALGSAAATATASVGAGGLAAALGAVGIAAGALAAAFFTTQARIEEIKGRMEALGGTAREMDLSKAIAAGKTAEELQHLGFTVEEVRKSVQGLGLDAQQSFKDVAAGFEVLKPDVLSDQLHKLKSAQDDANVALKQAKFTLDEARAAYAAHKVSLEVVTRAQIAYDEALKASRPHAEDWAKSVGGIAEATAKASREFRAAEATWEKLLDLEAQGKASAEAVATAYENVRSAASAVHKTFTDVATEAGKLVDEQKKLHLALVDAVDIWSKLKASGDKSAEGQLAVAKAMESVSAMAAKLGISVEAVGSGLRFSVADPSNSAAAALGALANEMNSLTKIGQDVIVVNGKLTPVMRSLGDSTDSAKISMGGFSQTLQQVYDDAGNVAGAIPILRGKVDELSEAVTDLSDHWVYMDSHWVRATELLQQVAQAAAGAAREIEHVASMEGELEEPLAHGARPGGAGGHGGRGPLGRGTYGPADLLSIYAAAGASGGTLDQIAQAMGLVVLGTNQYASRDYIDSLLRGAAVGGGGATPGEGVSGGIRQQITQLGNSAETTADNLMSLQDRLKETAATMGQVAGATGTLAPSLTALSNAIDTASQTITASGQMAITTIGGVATATIAAVTAVAPPMGKTLLPPISTGTPTAPISGAPALPPGQALLGTWQPGGQIVVNVNVTGNNVASDQAAEALAGRIMSAAVSSMRTIAGLRL